MRVCMNALECVCVFMGTCAEAVCKNCLLLTMCVFYNLATMLSQLFFSSSSGACNLMKLNIFFFGQVIFSFLRQKYLQCVLYVSISKFVTKLHFLEIV